jgi:hypothetical protein
LEQLDSVYTVFCNRGGELPWSKFNAQLIYFYCPLVAHILTLFLAILSDGYAAWEWDKFQLQNSYRWVIYNVANYLQIDWFSQALDFIFHCTYFLIFPGLSLWYTNMQIRRCNFTIKSMRAAPMAIYLRKIKSSRLACMRK